MKINFKNTWRPLPSCVTIKPSKIDGLGMFAVKDIPANTNLGLMRLKYNEEWIRTALGSYPNHSETSSCINVCYKNLYGDEEFYLITAKDLVAGDELTLTYQMPEYHQTD